MGTEPNAMVEPMIALEEETGCISCRICHATPERRGDHLAGRGIDYLCSRCLMILTQQLIENKGVTADSRVSGQIHPAIPLQGRQNTPIKNAVKSDSYGYTKALGSTVQISMPRKRGGRPSSSKLDKKLKNRERQRKYYERRKANS